MQFLLYCACGVIGVSSDYGIYYLSLKNNVWYQYANAFGYVGGTLVSFSLNRVFTFDMRDRVLQRLLSFLSVAGVGFVSSAILLWALVDISHVDNMIAKLITLPMVLILQYSLNRIITFKTLK